VRRYGSAMSSDDQESRRRELRSEPEKLDLIKRHDSRPRWYARISMSRWLASPWFTVPAILIVGFYPWTQLRRPAPSYAAWQLPLACFGLVWPIVFVCLLLWGRIFFRHMSPTVIAIFVIALAMFVEGTFAEVYYQMSAHSPHSFDPSSMSGIDAAYFTIGTATTGSDIHPVSGAARLWVSGQQIASVFLIVIAITTAVQRTRPPDEHAPGEPTEPGVTAADPTG
jgi:hypothetical protein